MRKFPRAAVVLAVAGITAISSVAPVAAASPANDGGTSGAAVRPDNRPGPFTKRQEARRKAAQKLILSGKSAPNEDGVIALAEDKYFEASVTGVGQVFTILAEFGDQGSGKLGRVPGPLHNEIAEPDRTVDNSTHWVEDFSRAHYEDLFFGTGGGTGETFADFYAKQSSGLYTVAGGVSDWVKVPGNASLYGDNTVEDFGGAWQFIADAGNAWYQSRLDAGQTPAQIRAELEQFDVWDRNDFDNDGDFDEPDGYIDHFQAVHAGEGEDAGGGAQGADAIWSHRWYVDLGFGTTGPTVGGEEVRFGGTQIGDSGIWIGDYTVEAENGGLGVFAHEFAHDLGLPDLYDTAGGDNGTGFWTVMSLGSWLNRGGDDIGTTPNYMGPWEKLQLGWLDYEVVSMSESGDFTLSPAALQVEGQAQAVIVDVPDRPEDDFYTEPASGTYSWWTSSGDDLNTTLTRSVDLTGVRTATVTAKAWYDIEAGYDFLYAEYSTNGGADWIQVGDRLDGSSSGRWTTLRYAIPGGAQTMFRFRYQTDTGVALPGAFLDDITIKSGGTTILPTDTVESGANGWTAVDGFKISTGTETRLGDRYYIAENRTYVDYDETLEVGPYQFSFALTAPNKVERFPAQDGLLVWMVDETWNDNDTINHPGRGQALPVDARPVPFGWSDGTRPTNRRQPFDATFGLEDVPDGPGLHKEVIAGKGKTQAIELLRAWPTDADRVAIPVFDDSNEDAYYSTANPLSSTKVAGHGVRITVNTQVESGPMTISVENPAAP